MPREGNYSILKASLSPLLYNPKKMMRPLSTHLSLYKILIRTYIFHNNITINLSNKTPFYTRKTRRLLFSQIR